MRVEDERSRIGDLEREAEEGIFSDYVRAGDALTEIRDERLFEPEGFSSFKDYVEARFEIHPSTATSLIQAADVAHDLSRDNALRLPQRHARLLYRFDSGTRAEYAVEIASMSFREA